jgi:orotidine-5'-phosphate decarboxylase
MTQKTQPFILALDNFTLEEIDHFVRSLPSQFKPVLKIGLELFCKHGPQVVLELFDKFQLPLFLDLKLHDIPQTVFNAIKSLEGLPLKFLTIHLAGGRDMLSMALKAQKEYLPHTELLGVSYLTSLKNSDFEEVWGKQEQEVTQLFEKAFSLAKEVGISGIVLSPHELDLIKNWENDSKQFTKVTPGIRFTGEGSQDQNRVATPEWALEKGSSFLVLGRALTQSGDQLDKRIQHLANLI